MHERQPHTAQEDAPHHSIEPTGTPTTEPGLSPAAPCPQLPGSDMGQRQLRAPALPPIPEACAPELAPEEHYGQGPSQAQAVPLHHVPDMPAAAQEPEQERAPVGITSKTMDPSPSTDSPPGFLIQSEAIDANLAACVEATPAQQQHALPALTAQRIGSLHASPSASSPAEAAVLAKEHSAESADAMREAVHGAVERCREPPHESPRAEESDVMGFSPGVHTLAARNFDASCLLTCQSSPWSLQQASRLSPASVPWLAS